MIMLGVPSKDDVMNVFSSLEYFNDDLIKINDPNTNSPDGIMACMDSVSRFQLEEYCILKMKKVRDVLRLSGEDALNAYLCETRTPDKTHPMFNTLSSMASQFGCDMFMDVLIPMSKDEFRVYQEVYNELLVK